MSAILSEQEIQEITGYKLAAKQVMELRRQGFFRARRAPVTGNVILERRHYDAVCTGGDQSSANEPKVRIPQVRTPQLRRAA